MSLPVLIGFAGVLVAAVATGLLAGRCVRQPRIDFILWTAATLALTVALAAQSMGFDTGFGATTFRAVQLSALLFAPLWLAWGLIELVAGSDAVRFGARLISSALTVVATVILLTDPLTAQPSGKSWPSAGLHFQPVAMYAIDVAQIVAVAAVAVSAGVAAARARQDLRWRPVLAGVTAVGLAVLLAAALRVGWPDRSVYPSLGLLAAALVWFGATRVKPVSGRDLPAADDGPGDRDGALIDGGLIGGGETEYLPDRRYATFGHQRPGDPGRPQAPRGPQGAGQSRPPGAFPGPGGFSARGSFPGPGGTDRPANSVDQGSRASSRTSPRAPREVPPDLGVAAPGGPGDDFGTLAQAAGSAASAGSAGSAGAAASAASAGLGAPGAPAAQARPYGRILIFTLLDDRVAEFDRLAGQAAEEVRIGESGTLVYVIHLVPNAPLQRIFYEVYRDRAAFDSHESQPYMTRFVADRRSCVLATNVIELRLKYAKVAPLPGPPAPGAEPARAAQGTQAQLPRGARGRPGPPRLEPLPPPGTLPPRGPARAPAGRPQSGRPYGGT